MVGFENEPNASFLINDDGSKVDTASAQASETASTANTTTDETLAFDDLKQDIND